MFALVLLAAAVTQVAMRNTNLRGDEYTYAAGATALGDVWRGRMSWGEALDIVLGTGWFMPGATMLAAPLHALIDMPGFAALRTWMALVNLTLLGLTGMTLGFSQWSLGSTPWGFWALPVSGLGVGVLIFLARAGHQRAHDEMRVLKTFVDEALGCDCFKLAEAQDL